MKVAVKQISEGKKGDFRLAILSLRRALGRTQEEMYREIGCSFAAYRKWESGSAAPGGKWLLKMLMQWPQEATAAFGLKSEIFNPESAPARRLGNRATLKSDISNLKSAPAPQPDLTPEQEDRLRHFSDAMQGLQLIYDAAEAGEGAADELLRALAEQLTTRGGNWQSMKYARRGRRKK
jgi:transcriptional regulator with XRE-family HTH domain